MTKRKKAILEDALISKTPQPFKTILIVLKYYTKEILAIMLLIAVSIFFIFNVKYSKESGCSIEPGIKAEIKKEL